MWHRTVQRLCAPADAQGMARHAYDTSVPPPFDADLGAAVLHRIRSWLLLSAAAVAAQVATAAAAAAVGPDAVLWTVVVAARGGGSVWEDLVAVDRLPVLVLWLTVPGLVVAGASAARVALLVRGRRPHRGVPRWMVAGLSATHALAPGLVLTTISAWAGWGAAWSVVAALLPQFGTTAVVAVLCWQRHQLNPFLWADPMSRGGRRARERWARRRRPAPAAADPVSTAR